MRRLSPLFIALACGLPLAGRGAEFTVTTTADAGAGSLRQAILDANTNGGADRIVFSIEGDGLKTISPGTALPAILDPVVIDGTTQPGYSGAPLIELNGTGRGFDGLVIAADDCTVSGLVVRQFGSSSSLRSGIVISNGAHNIIRGCYLGTQANGATASPNSLAGILIADASGNRVGGDTPEERNVISGNGRHGVRITGSLASNNWVQGNFIGLVATGTVARPNGFNGIEITNAPINSIGGTAPGAGNVIAGNGIEQVRIIGPEAVGNVILANLIGLKADGTGLSTSIGSGSGIRIDNAPSNTVGGVQVEARNVVGNVAFGLILIGSNAVGNVVQGNFIGTTPDGTGPLANSTAIFLSASARANVLGGTAHGAGNLISASSNDGISINGDNNIIQGNRIGTDVTGLRAIGNGRFLTGAAVLLEGNNNLVGGVTPSAGNTISGNVNDGVTILPFNAPATNNQVQGNRIGVGVDGTTALGNGGRGVVTLGAHDCLIGGDAPDSGNIIAYNGLEGVWVARTFGQTGTSSSNNFFGGNVIKANHDAGVTLLGPNAVLGNSIFDNGGLAIDRNGDGVTDNVPGADSNFPGIRLAEPGTTPGTTRFVLTLNNRPNCEYAVELFSNPAPDPTGYGECQRYLDRLVARTGPDGFGLVDVEIPTTIPAGSWITATATRRLPGVGYGFYETTEASMAKRYDEVRTEADLSVEITSPENLTVVAAGSVIPITIHVRNAGPAYVPTATLKVNSARALKWVDLETTLAGYEFESSNTRLFPRLTLTLRNLDAGEDLAIVVQVRAKSSFSEAPVSARVSSPQPDSVRTNNGARMALRIVRPALSMARNKRHVELTQPIAEGTVLQTSTTLAPASAWQPLDYAQVQVVTNGSNYVLNLDGPVGVNPTLFFRLTQEPPATPLITVSQESLNLDGTTESFAERGVVELVGSLTSGSPWYFNFSWNDTWQVQNVPVLPEGSNDVVIREFEFLLGSNGVPVFLGNLGFTLTTNPVSQMPPSTNEEPVFGFPVVARSGIQGEPLIYFPGNPLIGVTNLALTNLNSAVASWGARFPNREQDTNECAPAAVLNSLEYLNDVFHLNMPASELTMEKMKEATGWRATGAPGGAGDTSWPEIKRKYMTDHGLPIGTERTRSAETALSALKRCYDVEIRLKGHTACVRAITDLGDGRYSIDISDDVRQGRPGGTGTRTVIFDPAAGQATITGTPWHREFVEFVIESPSQ